MNSSTIIKISIEKHLFMLIAFFVITSFNVVFAQYSPITGPTVVNQGERHNYRINNNNYFNISWSAIGGTVPSANSYKDVNILWNGTDGGTVIVRYQDSNNTYSSVLPVTINYVVPLMPPAPAVTNNCGNTVLTTGNSPSGLTYYWQSTSNGQSFSNSSLSITLTSGTVYYLRAYNNSTRNWSTARTINYEVHKEASPPSTPVANVSCGSTILTRGTPPSGFTWYWQTTPNGTSTSNSSTSFTPTSGNIYYLRAKNNVADCWSNAVSVNYSFLPIPGEATVGFSEISQCGSGKQTLTAIPGTNANTTRWYNVASGGSVLHTGSSYTTSIITTTTTYYAASYNSNTMCVSSTRKSIKVTVGDAITWYLDADGDGFAISTEISCETPNGQGYTNIVLPMGDCDDSDSTLNPDTEWFLDSDGDHFAISKIKSCTSPGPDYTREELPMGDCEDDDPNINPDTIWYADADQDGLGDPSSPSAPSCTRPSGFVQNSNDQCPNKPSASNNCNVIRTDLNYIYTHIYQKESTASIPFFTANDNLIQEITYFDGLGRPIQQIGIDQSTNKNDIITHIGYDNFGRQTEDYLPYVGGTFAEYQSYAKSATVSYYFTQKYEKTSNPYSQKEFEASPLNRVLKQAAPGTDWAMDAGHETEFGYATNVNADNVKQYNITLSFANNIYTPTLIERTDNNGLYNEGQLYKNITKDENHTGGKNHTTEEFRDKQGRVILKRTYADADLNDDGDALDPGETEVPHDTYYVYNDYGNLNFVLPPKVNTDDGVALTELEELCYQYKYDERNRLAEKKIPGKDWEYIVYNKLDQPVLTQHANLRKENSGLPYHLWQFTKYDAFGRVAYTGLTSNNSTLSVIRSRYNQATVHYETRIATPNTMDNIQVYYSKDTRPTGGMDIYTVNYYDDYTFLQSESTPEFTNPQTVLGQTVVLNTKSLPTGSKVRVLETAYPIEWITTVTYYDKKGRAIYVASNNEHLNTIDVIETQYDFAGKVLKTKTTHTKEGNAPIITIDTFEYDHVGRLLTQTQKINTQDEEVIAENSYDALGQLTSKKVGGGLQKVDYTYNVRGWLKGINDVNNIGTDLFSFAIDYNNGANPLYNGNISKTSWKTANDNIARNYTYTYDALNRITAGISSDNNYNLSNVTYDKMGNILSLNRKGHTNSGATTFGDMDILSYTYDDGNKLLNVTDTANKTYGFKDGTNTNDDFEYDINGNMILDQNKGITGITYNHLNLPTNVTISNSEHNGNITYIYDATGAKLKKTVSEGSSLTTTAYAGNFVYKDGALEFFRHPEGYVEKEADGYKYVYQFKDHLDNIRLSYKDANKDGSITQNEIVQEKNYYPFGFTMRGFNETIRGRNHNYGFVGKEEQSELSLAWLDFGARNYDPTLGRWMNLDPLAEQMRRHSPYNYGFDNPVYFMDPDGMIPQGCCGKLKKWFFDVGTRVGLVSANHPKNNPQTGPRRVQDLPSSTSTGPTKNITGNYFGDALYKLVGGETISKAIDGDDRAQGQLIMGGLVSLAPGSQINLSDDIAKVSTKFSAKKIRFSQTSVNNYQRAITAIKNGTADPIDIVKMKDGIHTTLDNTRLLAAQNLGKDIDVNIYDYGDAIPANIADRFKNKKTGTVPETWGQAAENRTLNQNAEFRNKYGGTGTFVKPKINSQ